MRFRKAIASLLEDHLAEGLFVKVRSGGLGFGAILRALRRPVALQQQSRLGERIVVVGNGTAALSFVRALRRQGYDNVQVVGTVGGMGGNCVNFGCMPVGFTLEHQHLSPVELRTALERFVAALRSDVEEQFAAVGYPLRAGTAREVRGSSLILEDDGEVPFDRLVLAIGANELFVRETWCDADRQITLAEFWTLPVSTRVVIYADGNPSALGLADVAIRLGMRPVVLLAGSNPLAGLPSYRYYVRQIAGGGARVFEDVHMRRSEGGSLTFDHGNRSTSIEYERLLVIGNPSPRFIPIDGRKQTIFDLDLTQGAFPSRPDICHLGDGAGFVTALEAEIQAHLVVEAWVKGGRVDLTGFGRLPLQLHGISPLAMVGAEWTFAEREWHEIDFRSLGWSRISEEEGKLWYLLNESNGFVEGLHVCHPAARDLVGIASSLMNHSVLDVRWIGGGLHPSNAEIFRVLADDATPRVRRQHSPGCVVDDRIVRLRFVLPLLDDVGPSSLPDWLSLSNYQQAVLSREPWTVLAAYYGAHHIAKQMMLSDVGVLRIDANGELSFPSIKDATVVVSKASRSCRIMRGQVLVEVQVGYRP